MGMPRRIGGPYPDEFVGTEIVKPEKKAFRLRKLLARFRYRKNKNTVGAKS